MRKTNIERVTEFMEYGSPLRQGFVIEAITRYADQVAAADQQGFNKNAFISFEAWQQVAKEAQEAFAIYSGSTGEQKS